MGTVHNTKTVYKTKDGYIFESDVIIEREGFKYVIDVTDLEQIESYPLSKLASFGTIYDFIERYHPDYTHSNEVLRLDDLDCLIADECDIEKLEDLTSIWGSDPRYWEKERDRIMNRLFDESINNYKNLF